MATTYTVQKGDTLWGIATEHASEISGSSTSAKVDTLVSLNHISNPNYIVVGQVLKLSGSVTPASSNPTSKAVINVFGLQSNTDSSVYATWTWSKSNTENYQTIWYYDTGDGVWFVGSDSTTTDKQSIYSAPSNAVRVKFKVKPISKKRTVNNKETSYWTAAWSTQKTYDFRDNPPETPPVPTVSIDDMYKLTAKLDNLDLNATGIEFQVLKDNKTVFTTGKATINKTFASFLCTVKAGSTYKVRCRAYRGSKYSEWSAYSSEIETIPAAPSGITKIEATSETSVYLEWATATAATSYELEYTTKKTYFDGSDLTTTVSSIEYAHYEKTGLESGQEYFFRVRAINDKGHSAWSDVVSVVLGKDPAAPTTWSSTTTAVTGEPLNLYWMHNAEDGSSQTYAELELTINGNTDVITIQNSTDPDEKDKTSVYAINTSTYIEGTKISWRVRTAGITNVYGEWSVERTADIYAPPTLVLTVTNAEGATFETLESFPFTVVGEAGPNTQTPTGYYLTITSTEVYETTDDVGNVKTVNKGEDVYAKYFDTSDDLSVTLSAGDVDLENNVTYILSCIVSMNSGLTAVSSLEFTVEWGDEEFEPTAEIAFDKDTLVTYIRPYCEDAETYLSVYRREFDGTFTELVKDMDCVDDAFITDPHPALDYARYRVVARTKDTGKVAYCDVPAYPIGETASVIQWDEVWSSFDTDREDALEQPVWSGSMLKLPYNIDVSEKSSKDETHVKYIGRKHPVNYFGTQVGQTMSWKTDVPKTDSETLYQLRRLQVWMGNVYVREPSGSGYWASISVSFSQTHCAVVIPVTIEVTRVEGGA